MSTEEAKSEFDYFCVSCGREQEWGDGTCNNCGSTYLAHVRVYGLYSAPNAAFNAADTSTAMSRIHEAFEGLLYEVARLHRKERELEKEIKRIAHYEMRMTFAKMADKLSQGTDAKEIAKYLLHFENERAAEMEQEEGSRLVRR